MSNRGLLCFFLFMVITSLCSDLYGVYLLRGLRVRNGEVKKQLDLVSEHNAKLDFDLKMAADRQKREESKLDYILGGVQGVAILSVLTSFTTGYVAIETLEVDTDKVVMAGISESHERLSVFMESLKACGLFSSVSEPVIAANGKDGKAEVISFSLTCVTEAIEIAGSSKAEAESR